MTKKSLANPSSTATLEIAAITKITHPYNLSHIFSDLQESEEKTKNSVSDQFSLLFYGKSTERLLGN